MLKAFEDTMPLLAEDVFVDETAVVIGDVRIGAQSSIFPLAVLRGDDDAIRIGKRTNIQDHVTIHQSHRQTIIGDGVSVGHGAILHACTVHDDVLVGMHATILDGAEIGAQSIVAAGSVCPPGKSYPPRSMIMGTPAKAVRELREEEIESIKNNADHYVALAAKYRMMQSKKGENL